jgi:plastocyanin
MRAPAALLALTIALVPAFAGGSAPGAAVTMVNISFAPGVVTINPGEVVTWTNDDGFAHTVSADDGSWASGIVPGHASFSRAFDAPGVVAYHCAIHATMHGSVLVRDPALPDLFVAALGAGPRELAPGVDDPTQKVVTFRVGNDGGGAAGASVLRLTYSDVEGEHPLADAIVPALAPGQAYARSVAWNGLGNVGDFTLHALADATQAVNEGPAEGNNAASAQVSFLVSGSGEGVALLPLAGLGAPDP